MITTGIFFEIEILDDELLVSVTNSDTGKIWGYESALFDFCEVDFKGHLHDLYWIPLDTKAAIISGVQTVINRWERNKLILEAPLEQVPVKLPEDDCQAVEQNKDRLGLLELSLLCGFWMLLIVLVWIISKTDVGQSWGW